MDEYAKKPTLQEMSKQVIADKMLMKAVENYAEKNNRDVLMVTEFDNSAEIVISSRIRRKLENQPELVRALKELFENEDADDHDEDFKLFSSKRLSLPKLAVRFKDVERGWNFEIAQNQAILYLNILDYGNGGSKSLVTTKNRTAEKPEWWDDDNNFDKYVHPTKSKLKINEDVISSILTHYQYDPLTHCENPPIKEKKQKKKKQKSLAASVIEDDPAIIGVRHKPKDDDELDSEQNDPEGSKGRRTRKKSSCFLDSDSDNDEPSKKTKKKVTDSLFPTLPPSWFEINVIQKNIRERKEMEKALGIDKLSEDLRKGSNKTFTEELDEIYDDE